MSEQTWEDKLALIQSLSGPAYAAMRKPGNWYVSPRSLEIGRRGMLLSPTGNGTTPREAVEDLWDRLTTLPPDSKIVVDAYRDTRREYRWNGNMFVEAESE